MSTPHARLLSDLHETHRPRLERLVTTRVRDPELAADVVSEAFVRLHRELRADRVPDQPAAWLTRVALNLVVTEARHRRVVDDAAPRLARPTAEHGPAEVVAGRDDLRRVARALADLPEPDRALVLGAAFGASGIELGIRHGMTAGCARVRLWRARTLLRAALVDVPDIG
jgi:RNA polymerase sigma factor (sigma-70 family)